MQECVTEAGLLVLDGVWYSAGTRSQCSPQQWDKWSRGAAAAAAVEAPLAPPQPVQEVARHRTHNTVCNEPEAVTFPLLDSKTPPGRAEPLPSTQCFVCFALLNQHCWRHWTHRDAARARGSPGAFKFTVKHYTHAEEVNETHPVGKAVCLAPEWTRAVHALVLLPLAPPPCLTLSSQVRVCPADHRERQKTKVNKKWMAIKKKKNKIGKIVHRTLTLFSETSAEDLSDNLSCL